MNSKLHVCSIMSSPLRGIPPSEVPENDCELTSDPDMNGADYHELLGVLQHTKARFTEIRDAGDLHGMIVVTDKGIVAGMGMEGQAGLPYIDMALVNSELRVHLPGVGNCAHYIGHGIMRYYLDELIIEGTRELESDNDSGALDRGHDWSFRELRPFCERSGVASAPPETDPAPSLDPSPTGGLTYPPEPLRTPEAHATLDHYPAPMDLPFGLPPARSTSLDDTCVQEAAPTRKLVHALTWAQAAKNQEEDIGSIRVEREDMVEEGGRLGGSNSAGSSCPSLESIVSDEIDTLVFGLGHLREGTLEKITELYRVAGIAIPPPDTTYKVESMLALLTPTVLDEIRRTAAESEITSEASMSNDSLPQIIIPVTPPSPDTRSRIEANIAAHIGSDGDVSDMQSSMSISSSREYYKTAMQIDAQHEADEERDDVLTEGLDEQICGIPSEFSGDRSPLINPQISLPGFRAQSDGSARAEPLTYPHSFMGLKPTTFITSELRDHVLIPDLLVLADSPFHPSALSTYYYWRGLCRTVILCVHDNVTLIRRHFDRGNPELQDALDHPALKLIREYAGSPEAPLSPLFCDSEAQFLLITANFFRTQRHFEYANALEQLISTHFADDRLIRNVIKSGLVDGLQLPMLAKFYNREFKEWYDIVKKYIIDERTILGEDDD